MYIQINSTAMKKSKKKKQPNYNFGDNIKDNNSNNKQEVKEAFQSTS